MGNLLTWFIAIYLIGAVVTALMVLCAICLAGNYGRNGQEKENKLNDYQTGKCEKIALTCLTVLLAAVGWIPLLFLTLRSMRAHDE